jgi:hypothetical protein
MGMEDSWKAPERKLMPGEKLSTAAREKFLASVKASGFEGVPEELEYTTDKDWRSRFQTDSATLEGVFEGKKVVVEYEHVDPELAAQDPAYKDGDPTIFVKATVNGKRVSEKIAKELWARMQPIGEAWRAYLSAQDEGQRLVHKEINEFGAGDAEVMELFHLK